MADEVMTVQQYLSGKVRNIKVPDDAVATILLDAGCTTIDVEKTETREVTDEETGETITEDVTEVVTEKVTKDTDVTLLPDRERELCLAWMYVWIAGSPTQTDSTRDADADWEHTEGGERMSANVLRLYLRMANELFNKYDLPLVGEESWGLVGHGFRNPRKCHSRRWK